MTTRVEMLRGFPKGLVACEAGVRKAPYSKYMHEILQPRMLHLIDMNSSAAIRKFIKDKNNVKFHLGMFNQIVPSMPKIDLVYIDGMHDYDNVYRDLETFDKITTRWISGHDWIPEGEYNFNTNHDFRVREAVTNWLNTKDYYLTFITDDLSNRDHDPDADGGKLKLYSYVISKTKEDHNLFLKNINRKT